MTTDRALLEAAAKAAGMSIMWTQMPEPQPRLYASMTEAGKGRHWNPLAIRRDAEELADQLGLDRSADCQSIVRAAASLAHSATESACKN